MKNQQKKQGMETGTDGKEQNISPEHSGRQTFWSFPAGMFRGFSAAVRLLRRGSVRLRLSALLIRRSVLRKDHIQQNCRQSCDYDRRSSEDHSRPFRKACQRSRRLRNSHAQRNGKADDGGIAEGHFLTHDQLDSGHGDRGKHRDCRTAEDTLGNCGEQR